VVLKRTASALRLHCRFERFPGFRQCALAPRSHFLPPLARFAVSACSYARTPSECFSDCCSASLPRSLLGHYRRLRRRPWRCLRHSPSAFLPLCRASLTDSPIAAALRVIVLGNARLGQADEFGERRVRAARSARQRRGKRRHGRAATPVERWQVALCGRPGSAPAGTNSRP
jgi:hypothetical protein